VAKVLESVSSAQTEKNGTEVVVSVLKWIGVVIVAQ